MTYRTQHKAYLQSKLAVVTVNSQVLEVYDTVYTSPDRYPFACITSGELRPNISDTSIYDTATYRRGYTYTIIVVHNMGAADVITAPVLEEMDNWEEAILDTLQSRALRDGGYPSLDDVIVTDVTAPVNGLEINLSEGMLFKMFRVECRVNVLY
jgi:hypothetical protein